MTVRANWRDDAACRDADPDLFFPVGTTGLRLGQINVAKRMCQACPVQTQCLAWALDHGITDGVWGGTTEDERRAIRNLARRMTTSQAALELAPAIVRQELRDLGFRPEA
jgi:WhiB family transcriptional regulator, redox-sensing transcriptional regulator